MNILQLPLFLRKKFEKVAPQQTIIPVAPTAESTVMRTLPAYAAYLGSQGYSQSTQEKYFADIKKFSLFLREKQVGEITTHDIEQWIAGLLSKNGEKLLVITDSVDLARHRSSSHKPVNSPANYRRSACH